MKKATRNWLIAAAILVALGLVLFAAAMSADRWDFTKWNTGADYETHTHAVTDAFTALSIDTETADITLVKADDGEARVVCREPEDLVHTVTVKNGTLTVEASDDRAWYEYIGIHFESPSVTVYLPAAAYDSLTVRATTGTIDVPADFSFGSADLSLTTGDVTCSAAVGDKMKIVTTTGEVTVAHTAADALELRTTTGEITVTDVTVSEAVSLTVTTGETVLDGLTCRSLSSDGTTGELWMKNVTADETLTVTRSTGDVKLNGCDAASLSLKTTTGSVTGTLRSEKIFLPESSTGTVRVPRSAEGGLCEVTTTTGDIRLDVEP